MSPDISKLKAIIRELESSTTPTSSPIEAEQKLADLLVPLLRHAGYVLEHVTPHSKDKGLDFIARKSTSGDGVLDELAIEYKHFRQQAVGLDQVHRLLGAAASAGIPRAMLVTNARFTMAAREAIRKTMPVSVELIDIDALRSWVGRLEEVPALDLSEIAVLRTALIRKFIELIARDARYLEDIEWRELEHLLAEVFEGLGFSVELTPATKDGGKDIVLTCHVSSSTRRYYVEIKHWRSGKRVGRKAVKEFLHVIVNEEISGGLYLSTYGYSSNAIESLTEIERNFLRFGTEAKIASLCKTYQRAAAGMWAPEIEPLQFLYEETM